MIETSRSGNVFNNRNRLVARLDVLARNEDLQQKLLSSIEWDLIVCDEAHRMSASFFGGDVKYTRRYQLGQLPGQVCRHLLLMSATPHNGKEEDFQLFMALLEGDRFEGRFRDGVHYADSADMMRRLTKEELLKFDGRPLFPERRTYTVKYELSPEEAGLYSTVTDYVRTEMNRVQRFADQGGEKRNNVGFALQIPQRRLASSPAAIYESLKRRRERLEAELAEARLARKGIGSPIHSADVTDEILKGLEAVALGVLRSGKDTKWTQLDRILDDDLMIDTDGNRRKLIIFTEPKDTSTTCWRRYAPGLANRKPSRSSTEGYRVRSAGKWSSGSCKIATCVPVQTGFQRVRFLAEKSNSPPWLPSSTRKRRSGTRRPMCPPRRSVTTSPPAIPRQTTCALSK